MIVAPVGFIQFERMGKFKSIVVGLGLPARLHSFFSTSKPTNGND